MYSKMHVRGYKRSNSGRGSGCPTLLRTGRLGAGEVVEQKVTNGLRKIRLGGQLAPFGCQICSKYMRHRCSTSSWTLVRVRFDRAFGRAGSTTHLGQCWGFLFFRGMLMRRASASVAVV